MQELMRRRRRTGFVGRRAEVDAFRANLALPLNDPQRRFLFVVHGDAGVGKSSLLQHLGTIAAESGALSALIDYPVADVPAAMDAIAAQLRRLGHPMTAYDDRSTAYHQRRRELETDPGAPPGSGRVLATVAVRMALRAAGDVPVLGAVAGELDATSLVDQTERLRRFIGSRLRGSEDVQLLLAPVDVLSSVFVTDLGLVGTERPLALFLDTYERTAPVLDAWLRELLDGRHGELPPSLTIAIAGQHDLDANLWADYLRELVEMPLGPFGETDARDLLAQHDVRDERIVEVILDVSGRLPLMLATLAKSRPTDPAEVGDRTGDAVERFLKWVDDPRCRDVAVLGALPRLLDQDALTALVGTEEAGRLFSWLRNQPFVSEVHGAGRYHDVVRTHMLRRQRGQAPQQWAQHHRTLAEVYRLRSQRLEETYHRICADGPPVLPEALSSLIFVVDEDTSQARAWVDMLQQAGRDSDSGQVEEVGGNLLEAVDNDGQLDRFWSAILDLPGLDETATARALARRAGRHESQKRYDLAFADYDRAIALGPDDAKVLAWRGRMYRQRGRFEEALTDLDRAVELDPGITWPLLVRGETYRRIGRFEEALADLTQVIERGDLSALGSRREAYRMMGRHEEALADFARAIDPAGWEMRGSHPQQYRREVVSGAFEESQAVRMWCTVDKPTGFGTLMRTLSPPGDCAGRRVRFSATVRTERVAGWLGLWMRVDGRGDDMLAFDNMGSRPIVGTTGWGRYEVVLDVDPEAEAIAFGVLLHGAGSGWVAGVRLEPVDLDVATTDSV
jgi:tetratricopeptide (TPR) repeat protein